MHTRFIVSLLTLPLALSCAYAQETSSAPTVAISGFGTAAMTMSDTDKAEFARPNQASGVGKTARPGVDSNFGVQANIGVNAWLSFTAQGLVRKDAEDDFGAELAWAFAKAKVSEKLSIRVGRIGLPVFMISDYRNVGYANTMLRPPGEMYAQVAMNSLDGIDATWQENIGDTTISAQLAFGGSRNGIASGTGVLHLDTRGTTALNLVAEHGPLTVRFGRADTTLTVNDSSQLNSLLSALRATGAGYGITQLAPLANALSVDKKKASFTAVGLGLDWKNLVVQSEYARRKTDSYVNATDSWYVMAGYRIDKLLPYYNHAETKSVGHVANTVPAACPAGYPAACTPTLQALSAGVNALNAGVTQSTDTIGVRWDFYRSLALKVQIDRVRPSGSAGQLLHAAPGFTGPVTVGAVALDFVF
ncbi:MAG: hypothetical protein QFF03_16910 [Pseudomonadota bacterium]|nr:hypothetical protein [Pseudomonadota bacterium]